MARTQSTRTEPARVITINVPLPADLHRQVKIVAAQQGISLKAAVIAALEQWSSSSSVAA